MRFNTIPQETKGPIQRLHAPHGRVLFMYWKSDLKKTALRDSSIGWNLHKRVVLEVSCISTCSFDTPGTSPTGSHCGIFIKKEDADSFFSVSC